MKPSEYLENFYNHYDEEGRLLSKHGSVEFLTTMHYIEKRAMHWISSKNKQDCALNKAQSCFYLFSPTAGPGKDLHGSSLQSPAPPPAYLLYR